MAIEGDLQEMNFATLVQTLVQSDGVARIRLQHNHDKAVVYVENHAICHAELATFIGDKIEILAGESVIFELLAWDDGRFTVDRHIQAPETTMAVSWDYLLMEGLRQLDERKQTHLDEEIPEILVSDMLTHLDASDVQALQQLIQQQEKNIMASKSEQLREILTNLVNGSADIIGAAIVDNDGLLLASVFSTATDGNRVAAVSAGLISLASRSAQQLNQGAVRQTVIQAENGNIIAVRANPSTSFVALTPTGVNLGMAFMECRDAAKAIADSL